MANPEHLEILKQGVEQWNKWREEHFDVRPDLSGADLSGANLSGANLSEGNLNEADLSRADLSGAKLVRGEPHRSDLSEAILSEADLSEANLSRANLIGANLSEADLSGADVRGAAFTHAEVRHTHFADVDLSGAKGLETIGHSGPSTVGIDTMYKSRGQDPRSFPPRVWSARRVHHLYRFDGRTAHRVLLLLHQLLDARPGIC